MEQHYFYKYKIIQPRTKKYLVIDFLEEEKCIALYNFLTHAFAEKIQNDTVGQINKAFDEVIACRSDREFIEGKYSGLDIRCNYTEVFDTYYECDPQYSSKFSMYVNTRELYAMLQDYLWELRKFKANPDNYSIENNNIKKIKKIPF